MARPVRPLLPCTRPPRNAQKEKEKITIDPGRVISSYRESYGKGENEHRLKTQGQKVLVCCRMEEHVARPYTAAGAAHTASKMRLESEGKYN